MKKHLSNTQDKFLLNSNLFLKFGSSKSIPENAKIVYFADSFDALSKIN